jgi:PKD repeat protein
MDIKKLVLVGAVVLVIAVLLMPQSPVKIMGLAQPIGVAGYVKRTNNKPVIGATVNVLGNQVTTDSTGRFVTNGAAENGGQVEINAEYNGMTGSAVITVDLSKATQWMDVIIGQVGADFRYSPLSPKPNDTITFADASSGPIITWRWDFGDGATSTQKNPTHVFTQEKTYTVTHTVTDDLGTTKTATKGILVKKPLQTYTLIVQTNPPGCLVSLCKSFVIPYGEGDISCEPPKNSGIQGTLSYSPLSPGKYTLAVGKEGYLYKTVNVELTANQVLTIDLAPQTPPQTPQTPNIGMYIFMGAFIASFLLLLVVIARKKKK